MLKRHSQLFEGLFTAVDLLMVSFAWAAAYWIRFASGIIPIEKGIPPFAVYLKMMLFVWVIWAFVFRRFGLYRAMRATSRLQEIWLVVKANMLCVLVLLSVTYLFREKSFEFSRLVFLIFLVLSSIGTVASRSAIRIFLRSMRRKGYNVRYALIVGAEKLASEVVRRIREHPEYGISLVGCLASPSSASQGEGRSGSASRPYLSVVPRDSSAALALKAISEPAQISFLPDEVEYSRPLDVIGTYEDLPQILSLGKIDQVIVALPLSDSAEMSRVIDMIGDSMVDVRIVPDFHQFIQLGSLIEEFDGLPVVNLASTPLSGFNRVIKRFMDVTLGTLFFILSLPALVAVALAVKLTSRGPMLFSQERVGLDGRRFKIFKFRTMRVDAESSGARFATPGDPRVTPVGRFLRRYSLDEIPQLMNVILGQMSLVGPRPERPIFIEEFRQRIPRYMLRHKVQAGMTGWAQVNGWRGNTSIEKRIEFDLFYIENWSAFLDIKIILLTLIRNFREKNAY